LILFVWYPPPLLEAVGGTEILLTLLVADVILGPLLTFIVFKAGKKSLRFDLTVIGIVQVCALIFGLFSLLYARPVYIAALGHRFDLVQANQVDQSDLVVAGQSLPLFGPKWVGVTKAIDAKEKERLLFSALAGMDYGHFPQYHRPIESMKDVVLGSAQAIAELKKQNAGHEQEIDAWITSRGFSSDNVKYQGLKASRKDFTVMLDASTAEVIGIAPFKPWPQ
jgi:hypothetical protein